MEVGKGKAPIPILKKCVKASKRERDGEGEDGYISIFGP